MTNSSRIKQTALLSQHCSFRTGGLTNSFYEPESIQDLTDVIKNNEKTVFVGFGSNVLFPDKPNNETSYVSLKKMIGFYQEHSSIKSISLLAGTPLSMLAVIGFISGNDFDFTYLLPGSVGAGVYMNVKYNERQMSDIVDTVYYIDLDKVGEGIKTIQGNECSFNYKSSLFQDNRWLIVAFDIKADNCHNIDNYISTIIEYMNYIKYNTLDLCDTGIFSKQFRNIIRDYHHPIKEGLTAIERHRDKYHHFDFPSAGSVFKNSRELGKPIGMIIDELGLKGYTCGDAQISPYHGNIIINNNKATSSDILKLIDIMTEAISNAYNFKPQLEIKLL